MNDPAAARLTTARLAAVRAAVPLLASVPHAVVLDAGQAGDLTWLALRRIPGERLDLAWPGLTGSQRRDAVARLGAILGALHEWAAPSGAAGMDPGLGRQVRARLGKLGTAVTGRQG